MRNLVIAIALGLTAVLAAGQQSAAGLVGVGYQNPVAQMRVSPGQLVTLFVAGLAPIAAPNLQASGAAQLPTNLGGLSVSLTQTWSGKPSKQLPLISVVQSSVCADPSSISPGCLITALTVQIPFDLAIPNPLAVPAAPRITELTIVENGAPSQAFSVTPVDVVVHVVTSCDSTLPSQMQTCRAIVAHADGTLVSSASPARVGETIVMYALGLGLTTPAAIEGLPTPVPAPVTVAQFGVTFDYANPQALSPSASSSSSAPVPEVQFVGLTPGQVGLYQVNFTVQAPAFVLPACAGSPPSNLTVTLQAAGQQAYDTAQICVIDPLVPAP